MVDSQSNIKNKQSVWLEVPDMENTYSDLYENLEENKKKENIIIKFKEVTIYAIHWSLYGYITLHDLLVSQLGDQYYVILREIIDLIIKSVKN